MFALRLSALLPLSLLLLMPMGCASPAVSNQEADPSIEAAPINSVVALGRLVPEGELIKVSVSNAQDSRVNKLFVQEGDRIHYFPDNLSGGQKQRVAIARALVAQPKLVLADEPTAALDSQTGREVVSIMQELAREQDCAILLVTHDTRILDVADRIITMEDGRLVS